MRKRKSESLKIFNGKSFVCNPTIDLQKSNKSPEEDPHYITINTRYQKNSSNVAHWLYLGILQFVRWLAVPNLKP